MRYRPEVFIAESLTDDDAKNGRLEGPILKKILKLCGKNPIHRRFSTEAGLVRLMSQFRNSDYRYFHLSCHGTESHIHTTNDKISYVRFAEILANGLTDRRLFLSACLVGNEMLADTIEGRNKGLYSFAAPVEEIRFDHAAAIWAAFYVRMFSINEDAMKRRAIISTLTKVCDLFESPFYFAWHDDDGAWNHKTLSKSVTTLGT